MGAILRAWRVRNRILATDIARALNWSASALSRVESGEYPISATEAMKYLAWCHAPVEEMDYVEILQAIEAGRSGFWMHSPGGGRFPAALRSLIYHEETALASHVYEPEHVPALLQTEAYAAALLDGCDIGEAEPQAYLSKWMDRQTILSRRNAGRFVFFLHEIALRRPVGDATIMHDQLLHLVFSVGRSTVSIRIVPSTPRHQVVCRGPVTLFDYGRRDRPLVFLENPFGGVFTDRQDHVASSRELFHRLEASALSELASVDFMADVAGEYDRRRAETCRN